MDSEQLARLASAAAVPDADIDTSDPDASDGADWSQAVRGLVLQPGQWKHWLEEPARIQVTPDVGSPSFQDQGPGYQTRIDRVLRASMLVIPSGGRAAALP